MPRLGLSLALLPLLLALSCGGGGSNDSNLSAEEILSRAAARYESVKTLHFRLTHQNGTTQIPLGLRLVEANGDVVLPDRLSAEVEAKAAGGITVRVQAIAIGDKTWITNPFTREFQPLPGASLRDVVDPAALVRIVATDLQDASLDGSESVDGIDCYRIKGKMSSDAVKEALRFADRGRTLDVEVWVGKDDSLVRKARIKGPLLPDESADVARELVLSKFDAQVTIEEPR